MKKQIQNSDIEKYILKDPKLRRALARRSHYWFFLIYLSDYIKYKTAAFQRQMFYLTQDSNVKAAVIVAFRGSAKSTIMSLSYPIWAMIGAQKKKYIIILSQTQQLCKLILTNIKAELEKNTKLARDFGPFREQADQWNTNTLLVNGYNCRIASISCGESLRGIRHKQHRPDLIICDDVEDLSSVRNKEARDKIFNWLTGDVIPAGDKNTKIIVIGNMLHEDSLMMRLKKEIRGGRFAAEYRQYPLLDSNGVPLWKEKFTSQESIDELKSGIASESSWQREYLLQIIPDEDRVIFRDWIKYYDKFPEDDKDFRYIATGIDLAISKNESADYTAMVSARVYGYRENLKIYILPYPVNKRLTFPETVEQAKMLSTSLGNGYPTMLFIEEVGYQGSLIEELVRQGYPAKGVKTCGQDKKARLTLTTHLIKNGNVLFARYECEELTGQLTSFGYEKHDDLADAFAILVLKILESNKRPPIVTGGVL